MMKNKKNINGILLLDKPLHLSSNQALQKVKYLFSAKKAGHTGSLDPLATGMLPICFGETTKISKYLLEANKHYHVVAKLGEKTLTGDAEGKVIETKSTENITLEKLSSVIMTFVGEIEQIPPMFSALKYQGKPLYQLARQGIEVERKPRKIMIHSIQLEGLDGDTFSVMIHCSKGTYVRTLIQDIGDKLDCGAHVIGLRRTAVAPYESSAMVSLATLQEVYEQNGPEALEQYLLAGKIKINQ